ncbi:uncharacterized protein LOC131323868 [Rhododendron vialii]|uniref:uncharacterized protein LOC131323868 n=1 Tax=Rhododendron vialii TaxID=182163 RepID=UPI00265F0557|nr:uncharacterized protein LOC131323868 [Rhododendron vialii]
MNGLDPSSAMFRDLSQNPPKTMGELMTIIEKDYVHEEAVAERKVLKISDSSKMSPAAKKQVANIRENQTSRSMRSNKNDQQSLRQDKREPQPDEYVAEHTAFMVPIYKLLPMGFLGTAGSGPRMCTFHKERGHYTTQCRPFKKYLEELIAAGHLNPWIDTRKNPLPPPPPLIENLVSVIQGLVSEERIPELQSEIDRAVTALSICNIGASAKHKWEDPNCNGPITFTSEDLKGVQLPHMDALVVTLAIDKSTVQKVLIDQGSSADVMFFSTFKSLGLLPTQLRVASTPLVSFTGAPIWPFDLVTLAVRAGSPVVDVEFVVVSSPSPYNVILGRAWLHGMQAVASTFHQVMKFVGWNGRQETL